MIKHISYYKEGKRHVVKPTDKGLFPFKFVEGEGITRKVKQLNLTASEFIVHPGVRSYDPTITLEDGNKLRVYHAGNSTVPIVHPTLVAEQFDESHRTKRKTILEKKLESMKKEKDGKERKEQTTQPMHPICPPFPSGIITKSSVKVSNAPPQKKGATDDPFGPYLDSWFGITDDDDPNDGLYDAEHDYGNDFDDDGDW